MFTLSYNVDLKAGRMVRMDNSKPTKVEIQSHLIEPLLEMVGREASMLMREINYDFKTLFTVQHPVERRGGRSGPRPTVDYLIRGYVGDECQTIFPVEAKIWLVDKHASPISDYISRLAVHAKGAVCGLIIDQIAFQMLFSLFSDENGKVQPVILDKLFCPLVLWCLRC